MPMKHDQNLAIVFSGGGARGAYQIGVWRALQELQISDRINAVYGTSVGAINGAAFIQNDIKLAEDIWQQMDYKNVFADIQQSIGELNPRKKYYQWIKGTIANKGMDVSPLKTRLRDNLDEALIRKSNKKYGLVAFNLENRKGQYLEKEDIPEGELIEYVIASATFPTFQPHRINGQPYLDGGIVDNRPLSFLAGRDDIDTVICIDVTIARHFWKQKRTGGQHKVHYIRPSRLLGSPLAFRPEKIRRNMDLGYEDGMKQLLNLL